MLSALLGPSSRRAWCLGRPAQAVLRDVKVSNRHAITSVRYFSFSVEGDGVSSSGKFVSGKEEDENNWRNNAREEKILGALKTYKEINGHLFVSRPFVVPTGDLRWPFDTWGYNLGTGVNTLRKYASKQKLRAGFNAQLKEMGFVFDHYQSQWDDIIMPALRHYNKVYGNTDVPKDFVVPNGDDEWPRQTWGFKMGSTVNHMRSGNVYSQQVRESEKELKQLKFCHETTLAERDWSEKVLPTLRIFRQERYHCLVRRSFKVPMKSPWPQEAWGLRLGQIVGDVRTGHSYREQVARDKDLLIHLNFVWDHYATNWSDRLLPALEMFAAEYGNCHVVRSFVVPCRDPWPKKVWGLKLGTLMYGLRYRGDYFPFIGRDAARLEVLGFTFELNVRAWEKKVVPLLAMYAKVFGEKAVPRDFVIPPDSPWPKKMWGVHLGIIVDHNQTHIIP